MRQHKNSCESLSLAKESISSYPYITSYTLLAELADRAYLEDWDTEEAVKYSSILNNLELDPEKNIFYAFSTPERVPECIASLSRNNKKWYIIIGRSDSEVVNNYAEFILKHDFIIGIASQNTKLTSRPDILSIPLGIENKNWGRKESKIDDCPAMNNSLIIRDFQKLKYAIGSNAERDAKILASFSLGTNREIRGKFLYWLALNPNTLMNIPRQLHFERSSEGFLKYLHLLLSCQYSACPQGNGLDTHRLYESLYMGVVPICHRDAILPCHHELIDFGFSIKIISDYAELQNIEANIKTGRKLTDSLLFEDNCLNPLNIEYWLTRIREHATSLLN